jgi:hypothetical protein
MHERNYNMAEVKINITAEDNASSKLINVKNKVNEIEKAFEHTESSIVSNIDKILRLTGAVEAIEWFGKKYKDIFYEISRLYREKSIFKEIAEEQKFLNERAQKYNDLLKELNYSSLKDLNKAIDEGAVVWDAASRKFVDAAVKTNDAFETITDGNIKQMLSELELLFKDFDLWKDFEAKTGQNVDFSVLENRFKELTNSLAGAFSSVFADASKALDEGVSVFENRLSGLDKNLSKTLTIDTGSAVQAVKDLTTNIESINVEKTFRLDISSAFSAIEQVKSALASIPDVTVKTVVMKYETQASPLMPFTEGIDHIKGLMESLPGEGTYRVKFMGQASPEKGITETVSDVMGMIGGLSDFLSKPSDYWTILWRDDPMRARGEAGQITNTIDRLTDFLEKYSKNLESGKQGNITFSPTININGSGKDGGALAKEIDHELAGMWRADRSELKKEATK